MEEREGENLVLIDADSIIYIVGSDLQNLQLEPLGILKLDEFISSILKSTWSKNYLGFVGGSEGRNFRKYIAVSKPYKGNRQKEKPEWFDYWKPILMARMINYWGFVSCENIEADDACAIARTKFDGQYDKITIASPDKDLFQIAETYFYDYTKRTTVYCETQVAIYKLCHQMITGDSTDNIPGCEGVGKILASDVLLELTKTAYTRNDALRVVRSFYLKWYTVTLRENAIVKQQKEFLLKYKKDNNISKLTAAKKAEALKEFHFDDFLILTKEQALEKFKEQRKLITLLNTEAQGLEYDFILPEPIVDDKVDWEALETFKMDMDLVAEEDLAFDFEDEL
jgi:5'-3' exonuclease